MNAQFNIGNKYNHTFTVNENVYLGFLNTFKDNNPLHTNAEYAKNKGADFQQYLLRGQTIFEYPIGPLKARGFTGYYKDYFNIRVGTGEQRQQFEANMQSYLEKGIKHLQQKGII